jgi:hypothetical protein
MGITHDGLYALLKSKNIAVYLPHAQNIRKGDMAGMVNEKIIHEEPNSIEDKSVQGDQKCRCYDERTYFCSCDGKVEDTIS